MTGAVSQRAFPYAIVKSCLWRMAGLRAVMAGSIATLATIVSAQTASTNLPYYKDPFRHIAEELENTRVVAIADFAHQNAYPFHTVTAVLSNWLSLVSPNGGQLVLALEMDERMAEVLRRYLKTGDLEPVLEFWLPFNSLDTLEFYDHLREFTLRVEQVNQDLPEGRRMGFQVLGLEPWSLLSTTNVTAKDLPDVWQAGEVANERDRHAANTLLTYLKEHPKDRMLVFYGDAHLRIRPSSRSWAARIFGATEARQPLGLLLKSQLGTNFLSVAQVRFPPSVRGRGSLYHALTAQDILIKASDVPWKHPRIEPLDYDAVVFFSATRIDEAHLLKYICSRRILDRAVSRLSFLEQLSQNAFAARHPAISGTMEGLRLITGKSFQKSSEWQAWMATNAYDGFARMDSEEFSEAIRQECGRSQKGLLLASLGLPPTIAFRNEAISPEQWREVWPKVQPTVRFLQCLGIFWVGYPDEKAKAREYLAEFSGKEFESPALYLQWLRKNRLGLNY